MIVIVQISKLLSSDETRLNIRMFKLIAIILKHVI